GSPCRQRICWSRASIDANRPPDAVGASGGAEQSGWQTRSIIGRLVQIQLLAGAFDGASKAFPQSFGRAAHLLGDLGPAAAVRSFGDQPPFFFRQPFAEAGNQFPLGRQLSWFTIRAGFLVSKELGMLYPPNVAAPGVLLACFPRYFVARNARQQMDKLLGV